MNCDDIVELSGSYLAGELDSRRAAGFASHVDACPACARAVELDARLRRAILHEEIDTAKLNSRIRRGIGRNERRRAVWIAAGMAAAVIVAVLAYRVPPAANGVDAAAAQDHRREVVDRERRAWIGERDGIEALAHRQGIEMSAIGALAPTGYRLEHAKLCRLTSGVFLHLVYTDGSREVSVFLRQPDSTAEASIHTADIGREHVAAFQNSRATAIVVADQSHDALKFAQLAATIL